MSNRSWVLVWSSSLLALAACAEEAAPRPVAPITVRIEQDITHPLLVPRGDSVVLDVHTEHAGGVPAQGQVIQWALYGDSEALVVKQSVAPGHDRVTIGPLYGDTIVVFTSRICPDGDYAHCDGGAVATSPKTRVHAFGGFPALSIAHGPMDLTVGERRPIRAIGLAQPPSRANVKRVSHHPVILSSEDGRILEVEDDHVLVGIAPGTATVRLTGPGMEQVVPVRVYSAEERPMRALENTSVTLRGEPELGMNAGVSVPRGAPFESMVIDGEGNPVVLVELGAPTQLAQPEWGLAVQTLLLRWTGTDWGAEAPFLPSMTPHFPVMAKDERGVLYVAAFDWARGTVVVAERELDDIGGDFRYTYLPVPAFVAAEGVTPDESRLLVDRGGGRDHQSVSPLSDWVTLHPRAGGGVHFAYTPSYALLNCKRALIVGTLDPSRHIESDEVETYEWTPSTAGFCDSAGLVPTGEVHFLPPVAPSTEPTIIPDRYYVSTYSEAWRTRTIAGVPAPGIETLRLSPLLTGAYRFDDGDRAYTTGVTAYFSHAVDPFGATYNDDPTLMLYGSYNASPLREVGFVASVTSSGSRIVTVHDELVGGRPLVTSWTLPPAPPIEGAETSEVGLAGRRIGHISHPAPVIGLAVMPDGKRVALADRLDFRSAELELPALLQSTGPDSPWRDVESRAPEGFDPRLPLRTQGSTVYTVTPGLFGLRNVDLHTSTDAGDTWSTRRVYTRLAQRPTAHHLFADGSYLVVSVSELPQRHLYVHTMTEALEWAPPTGWTWNQDETAIIDGPEPGHVTVLAIATQRAPTDAYRLVMREHDETGALVGITETTVPPGLRLHTAVRLRGGDMLLFKGVAGVIDEPITHVLRIDGATREVRQTELSTGEIWRARQPILQLQDGTLVVGIDRMIPHGLTSARQAAYVTSMDGVSWSAPVALRPAGGAAQFVYASAVDGESGSGSSYQAHVLFVVGDSGTLWPQTEYATEYTSRERVNALTAPLVPMSIRVRAR